MKFWTPEEKQRYPADSEAVEGMGPISTHKGENLMPTDRGISLYRRRVRRQIRELKDGILPPQPFKPDGMSIRTYGQDTVLNLPPKDNDDMAYLTKIGETVLDLQFAVEQEPNDVRDTRIIEQLKTLETNGID